MLVLKFDKSQRAKNRIIQIGDSILQVNFSGHGVVKLSIEGPATVQRKIDRFTPAGIEQLRVFERKTGNIFLPTESRDADKKTT